MLFLLTLERKEANTVGRILPSERVEAGQAGANDERVSAYAAGFKSGPFSAHAISERDMKEATNGPGTEIPRVFA